MTTAAEWDHLRTFEAVARLGSLTLAARALGLSQSSVSRHVSRLEQSAGSPLFMREAPVRLTLRGEALLDAVRPMVDAALAASTALVAAPELVGEVTITTVGEVLRWQLAPRIAEFTRANPQIRLRILSDNRVSSLAAGDADVSVRLARPERGELVARRLRTISFGLFAARTLALGPDAPWLGLTGSLAKIPEQVHAERAFAPRPATILVEDTEALGAIVRAGVGVAVLPRSFASRLEGVVEVAHEAVGARALGPIPKRSVWLVVHRSKQKLPAVRAVMRWIDAVIGS
jgi:DNA-binding transcriptional LysR family regulator